MKTLKILSIMLLVVFFLFSCEMSERINAPQTDSSMVDDPGVVSITVGDGGLLKPNGTYRIAGTFTDGWEVLPSGGKDFFLYYALGHHFVVTGSDGVPMTNIKVNGETPPEAAWSIGQYWFDFSIDDQKIDWEENGQGWRNVTFWFETGMYDVHQVYFLGDCTDAYLADSPELTGWQRVRMDSVDSDYRVALANKIEVERRCVILVTSNLGVSETWPLGTLYINGNQVTTAEIERDGNGVMTGHVFRYLVHADGSIDFYGNELLDGVAIHINP
jgi:hypothetical protein